MKTVRFAGLVTVILVLLLGPPAEATHSTFAPGDVFVSFEKGPVQWRNPDGTLNAVLVGVVLGPSEGMRFDAAGDLYVAHWCSDPTCTTGNTIEKFNINGVSQGAVGSGYNCNPHALAFDAAGNAYVGQADCTGDILRLSTGQPPTAYAVAAENRGSFWIDLASDGCTIFYTSWGPDVKRFNVCTNTQLADFNRAPLPGGQTQGLRLLPDGGVLVSSGAVVARLDATGALVQIYSVSTGEVQYWAGLDLVGDGTFWAANYYSSNVYKFDLTTGAVQAGFNTGTPAQTVVDVRVSVLTGGSASAQMAPNRCDSVTGGGRVLRNSGAKANFGVAGGCKSGAFWGHLDYVDHGMSLHVHGTSVTAYMFVDTTTREICGTATSDLFGNVDYHVRVADNGSGSSGVFEIWLGTGGNTVYTTQFDSNHNLGGGGPGGGDIKLYKPDPASTGSFTGMCRI